MDDELELRGRKTTVSNATFLGSIGEVAVVDRPVLGERPLWDFPDGRLAGREAAAHLVSEAFGWDIVPRPGRERDCSASAWCSSGSRSPGAVSEMEG